MAWTKEECEADALHSHEKVVGTVISVSSVEVFMNGVIQHHLVSASKFVASTMFLGFFV